VVSGGGSYVDVDPPLFREGDVVKLDRAGAHSSGYLSKEDWLMFSNITTGFRIWQYCDVSNDPGVRCKITSFNNVEIPFNPGSIVNGSAVIVKTEDSNAPPDRGLFGWLVRDPGVCVIQHIGDEVVLSRAPKSGAGCRLYFLVSLPAGTEIPVGYEGAPQYVRKVRSEYFDFIDLNSSKTEFIKGKKSFKSDISFESGLSVAGDATLSGNIYAHSISLNDTPQSNYVLTSSALGRGSWQPSPLVSEGPPLSCYNGQLWVKSPEYDLYVYDGNRECWVGVAERSISGWSGQLVAHSYLSNAGNLTSEVLPFKCVLVGMTATSERGVVWTAEIHTNNSSVSGAAVGVGEDGRGFRGDLNIEFNAGDRIQFFVNGHNIDRPKIEAIFRKCL